MPRKKNKSKKKDYTKPLILAGTAVALIAVIVVAWVLPVLQQMENPLMTLIDEDLTEEEVLDNPQVTVKIYCKKLLARTSSDQLIDIYNYDLTYIETVTTSSGVATLGHMYHTEQSLWAQGRQAAPASADPYVTGLTEFIVPVADAGDTVSLGTLWVRDVTATAATFAVTPTTGAAVSDTSTAYFNTTDTAFTVQLTAIDSNTYYGMESFTDHQTGREYLGGLWFVWKGTIGQSFAADYAFADGTNVYYVFYIGAELVDDANSAIDDILSAVIATQGGAALVEDATVNLDVYDGIWLINNGVNSVASFIDVKSVTAIDTKVDDT